MKHLFTTLILCAAVGICHAQTDTLSAAVIQADTMLLLTPADTVVQAEVTPVAATPVMPELFRKNSVKMNLSSLAFNNYSFSYERAIARKITLAAGYSFLPETKLADIPVFSKAIEYASEGDDMDGEEDDMMEAIKGGNISSSAITGEVRFYTGKNPGARGFYASVYGRYSTFNANYMGEYEDGWGTTHDLPYKGTLNGFGGGVMLGAQWLIAKRVTFDWYIIGGHFGKLTGNLSAKADLSDLSQEDKDELENEIEEMFNTGGKSYIQATVDNDGMRAKVNGPFAGIRGFGFNIGIAF